MAIKTRLHLGLALCALVLVAATAVAFLGPDMASAAPLGLAMAAVPLSAPNDGQIALTLYNDGDGTWSVRHGPNGPILKSGLTRAEATAIVGSRVLPDAADDPAVVARSDLEQLIGEIEQNPDPDVVTLRLSVDDNLMQFVQGQLMAVGGELDTAETAIHVLAAAGQAAAATIAAKDEEIEDLRRSINWRDQEIKQLNEKLAAAPVAAAALQIGEPAKDPPDVLLPPAEADGQTVVGEVAQVEGSGQPAAGEQISGQTADAAALTPAADAAPPPARDPFDHDGDGRPGGSLSKKAKAEAKAKADAEQAEAAKDASE